jgi:hypothetical protein
MGRCKYHFYTDGGVYEKRCYDLRIAKKEAKNLAKERQIKVYLYTYYPSGRMDLYDVFPNGEIISNGTMGPFNN